MATLVLSAVGASLGGALGGTVLGLSSAVIGRAVGATLGRLIDQRLFGLGSEVVPTGRIDRFHLTHAGEGEAVRLAFGRVRVGGQVIWASRFSEEIVKTGASGKGSILGPKGKSYAYSVSLAVALGEGVVTRIGRVWADGEEVAKDDFNMRFYPGDEVQLPDPKIEAVEGTGEAPAFRGTAYVVFEDLALGRFGNRVPQFSFEVFRRAQPAAGTSDPGANIAGVSLIPGTGEYALATTPVHFDLGPGLNRSANVNTPEGKTDFLVSLGDLREEVTSLNSVSLVVSWFGDDLRCDRCTLDPRVEQADNDGVGMPWTVSGLSRGAARLVSQVDGSAVFGGTQSDQSVIEAIKELRSGGQEVMFYPFILMDIQAGNGLGDPWTGAADQPKVPWRGRITLSAAPGVAGSPDGTAAATAEVAAFFGSAQPGDFTATATGVDYTGQGEWSYRRFILHYAHLCAAAGGVDGFCIGSELRSLTQIRDENGAFPAVDALVALAAELRAILGPDTKIGYAADWSEYFGYHPEDGSGDVLFNLDPLWSAPDVDFVGIDNYMPLSDWRDGEDHADAAAGSIMSLGYLEGNVAGGEGFDWYYASDAARDAQIRTPIVDGAHGEDWVFRYKDIRGWWENTHHDRVGGVRSATPTAWAPASKPVWFTEMGCAAIDKATNEPNAFLDAKSAESRLPRYSNGLRDDAIQFQYLRAVLGYWGEDANNPVSPSYGGPMVDLYHAHVWAWDARPWPAFPARTDLWSDGVNHARGHWLNGRLGAQALADVAAEICERAGVVDLDLAGLAGTLRGYAVDDLASARAALQPLMLAFEVDAAETDGTLRFANRGARPVASVDTADLALEGENDGALVRERRPEAETAGVLRLGYVDAGGRFEASEAEAIMADEPARGVSRSEVAIVMTRAEAQATAERWLAESRVARDTVALALPPSRAEVAAGDVIALEGTQSDGFYRVDRVAEAGSRRLECVRVERSVYAPADQAEEAALSADFTPPVPVYPLFLDLPLMEGSEVPQAPHLAIAATPWPGSVAVYASSEDAGYELNTLVERGAVVGLTQSALIAAAPDRWDRGVGVDVRIFGGTPASATERAVLDGANLAVIGSGSDDDWELFQFANAELVAPDIYRLTTLLRGQAGSEAMIAAQWPIGSQIVLMDGAPNQIDLPLSLRDLARHYRIGPARRTLDDPTYVHDLRAFAGIGLRPYAPVHLKAEPGGSGETLVNWVRRTRIGGDSWSGLDVPLGEAFEAYLVRVLVAGSLVRETTVTAANWTYDAAAKAADGIAGPFTVEVAQISDIFGPGTFARIDTNG